MLTFEVNVWHEDGVFQRQKNSSEHRWTVEAESSDELVKVFKTFQHQQNPIGAPWGQCKKCSGNHFFAFRALGVVVSEDMIPTEPRRVSSMEVGEDGYVIWSLVIVDQNNRCYISRDTEIVPTRTVLSNVVVERKKEGYVITVPSTQRLRSYSISNYDGLVSVIEINTDNYSSEPVADVRATPEQRGAKVPEKFIAAEPPKIKDMKVGETGYISVNLVFADMEGFCFLAWACPVSPVKTGMERVMVERKKEGFSVTLPQNALLSKQIIKNYSELVSVFELKQEGE